MNSRMLGCLVLALAAVAAVGQGAASQEQQDAEEVRAVLTDYVEVGATVTWSAFELHSILRA
jgi:hypothetical protein